MLTTHRPTARLIGLLCVVLFLPRPAAPQAPATTTIRDTVYRADGQPASGRLVLSWPAFTTSEAIANRDILDENKFRDGLSKIIDGTVQCLNASAWAKQ